jgi:hypothetical protein
MNLALSLFILFPSLGQPVPTAKVIAVHFSAGPDARSGTISIDEVKHCGATRTGSFTFRDDTKFEYGHDNPVDSSKLVVATRIEFKCWELNAIASKITIIETGDTPGAALPRLLPNGAELGNFPLDTIIGRVAGNHSSDRFDGVAGAFGADAQRLKVDLLFGTGDCRVNLIPRQLQCDYANSARLSGLLAEKVREAAKVQMGLEPLDRSDGSTTTYIDRGNRVLVRVSNLERRSTITVETY